MKSYVILIILSALFTYYLMPIQQIQENKQNLQSQMPKIINQSNPNDDNPTRLSNDFNLNTGAYKIFVGNYDFLDSAEIAGLQVDGQWYSASKNMTNKGVSTYKGEDSIGTFQARMIKWVIQDKQVQFNTHLIQYDNQETIVFRQEFPYGVNSTNVTKDKEGLASSFPNFQLYKKDIFHPKVMGFFGYFGTMNWYNWGGQFQDGENIPGGSRGGFPLVIFSPNEFAIVMSPLNNFFSASQVPYYNSEFNNSFGLGVMGSYKYIEPGMTFDFIIQSGSGINDAVDKWGKVLRNRYHKTTDYQKADFISNYLGYWTDFGACYYYNLNNFTNYQDAMLSVINYAKDNEIPFRYLQLDSWWYYKAESPLPPGILNWTAMSDVFPKNSSYIQDQIKMPIASHSKFFSGNTDYKNYFDFYVESDRAVPYHQDFWNFFMCDAKQNWDLKLYLQDWIDYSFDQIKLFQHNVTAGRTWLKQMGNGGDHCDVNIMYCMTYPRHTLQSIEIPRVTSIRASDDYLDHFDKTNKTKQQWKIGRTSMFASALGLIPFKDSLHTTSDQPGCKFTPEKYPELQMVVACLSTGPVGPNDLVGKMNKTLIMKSCMPDGRLLKPQFPAMSIDSEFYQQYFGGRYGPRGNVWKAHTYHGDFIYYNIFANNLTQSYNLSASELFPNTSQKMMAVEWHTRKVVNFDSNNKIQLDANGIGDFRLWHASPIFSNGIVVFGELDKVVPMSVQRINWIENDEKTVRMQINGVVNEVVDIYAYVDKQLKQFSCKINSQGSNTLVIPDGICI